MTTKVYHFQISCITKPSELEAMNEAGEGIANSLSNILFASPSNFYEIERHLISFIPQIQSISLKNGLFFIDKFGYCIPVSEASNGILFILAILTALYQQDTTNHTICFRYPERCIHPWLLYKLANLFSICEKQIIIETHSNILKTLIRCD